MIRQHVKKIGRRHVREVIIYGAVGLLALALQDLIYWGFHRYWGVYPSVAMLCGTLVGMLVAFYGHVKFTFRKNRFCKRELIKFILTAMVGLVINVGGVRFITKVLLLSPSWGLAPTFVAPGVTFLISKFWTFR